MQILTIDIGTGTQDIYLLQSDLSIENGFKLVMPSPTMMVWNEIQKSTHRGENILLTGFTMGGGPGHWAAENHLKAGHKIYATLDAARSFNDDPDWLVKEMGIELVSDDEIKSLPKVREIVLRDFDYARISSAFQAFGVNLSPSAIGVAVFDHGEAPPHVSDRKFRFEYLEQRMREDNQLMVLAYRSSEVPESLTRMHAVVKSAGDLPCPLTIMDTAPAAVAGAILDPPIGERERVIVMNIGNFHTLAFQLGPGGVEGLFEHHTGMLDTPRLERYLTALAEGTLTSEEVFNDQGHGALILGSEKLDLNVAEWNIAITGPRRNIMNNSRLPTYLAVPFGDMMLTGCFGLLVAIATHQPELHEDIMHDLLDNSGGIVPWDLV